MSETELTSSLLKYDDNFFEIIYSDDRPYFIYIPRVSLIFILLPHQLFPKVIQKYPPEDLFEVEGEADLPSLEHLQI